MNLSKTLIEQELKYWESTMEFLKSKKGERTPGHIRISTQHGKVHYYLQSGASYKYLQVNDTEGNSLARAIAQQSYYDKLEILARKRHRQLSILLKDFKDFEADSLYDDMHSARQSLVVPVNETWGQKVKNWKKLEFQSNPYPFDELEIFTEKGERVRSKTEKIIADYLYYRNIEYHYEEPLVLNAYQTIYPDFTIMSNKLHKKIYWEHNGRMDDPGYSSNAVRKLNTYTKHGIHPGENLILTWEAKDVPLDTEIVKSCVNKYLL